MSRFFTYVPEQEMLLPARVQDVLGADHLCFFMDRVLGRFDLSGFEAAYSAEGGMLYHPAMMLRVWLYAYALGITSSRRLEQRVREDLAFRYLAAGSEPDYWALNAFRRRHRLAINTCFTWVLELAAGSGLRRLGAVAVDATRVKASASPDKVVAARRGERARTRLKVRSWQKACDTDDSNEGAGASVPVPSGLEAVPAGLEPLKRPARSAMVRRSITDPAARFLKARGRHVLGYTAEIAVTEDHLIVAQRVTQASTDNASLPEMAALVEHNCGTRPGAVTADSGYYSRDSIEQLERRGIDVYVPDSNMACELNRGTPADDSRLREPYVLNMRTKMRSEEGRKRYLRRKATVEPVFGVLKEQRNMRGFRMRSLEKVAIEWALATTAYNLTRLHKMSSNAST